MGISIETIGYITQKHFIFYWMLHFQRKGFESQNDSRTLDFAICRSDKACTGQNAQSIANISSQISSSCRLRTIFMFSSDTVMMR